MILSSEESGDEDDGRVMNKFPSSPVGVCEYLYNSWECISPPFPEKDLIGSWYAGVYYTKKKGTLYVGRIIHRFLVEENGPVECLKMDCLKPASAPSSTILEEPPEHLGKDEGDFVAHDIIAGPL